MFGFSIKLNRSLKNVVAEKQFINSPVSGIGHLYLYFCLGSCRQLDFATAAAIAISKYIFKFIIALIDTVFLHATWYQAEEHYFESELIDFKRLLAIFMSFSIHSSRVSSSDLRDLILVPTKADIFVFKILCNLEVFVSIDSTLMTAS